MDPEAVALLFALMLPAVVCPCLVTWRARRRRAAVVREYRAARASRRTGAHS